MDVDALLAPIPGDLPQGIDPRLDFSPESPFRRMQAARRAARAAERDRKPVAGGAPEAPDWQSVAELAMSVLSTQAKDVEAAAALMEAAVKTEGLPGLTAAAAVLEGMVRRYWGSLYPAAGPDEDAAAECLRPLVGLGKVALVPPIRLTPLFPMADGTPATLGTFDAVAAIERLPADDRQRRLDEGALTQEALMARAASYASGLAVLAREAKRAQEAWMRLEAALQAAAEDRKPPTSDVRDALEQVASLAARLAPALPPVENSDDAETTPPPGPKPVPAATGAISSREDALRRLAEVAAWFRQSEPQSPLSYTLEEAVRRGRMSLPDLLAEIVADYGERARILTALGIRPPPETIE